MHCAHCSMFFSFKFMALNYLSSHEGQTKSEDCVSPTTSLFVLICEFGDFDVFKIIIFISNASNTNSDRLKIVIEKFSLFNAVIFILIELLKFEIIYLILLLRHSLLITFTKKLDCVQIVERQLKF